MQRFGNLKVGSVSFFFSSRNRTIGFRFSKINKIIIIILKIKIAVSVFCFGLEVKTGCLCLLLRSMTTSYYVDKHHVPKKTKKNETKIC